MASSKLKIRFFTFSLKKNLLSILFIFFTISLVIFSKDNLSAAKNGLKLWVNNVVPAIFPFFIATELLSYTNIIPSLGKYLQKIMYPLFRVPGEGSFALLMGIISGYPIGAKIVTKFRENGTCSREECERLLAFTNNSGPLFILGTVGISLFSDTSIGILLLATHLLACISVGLLFRFWKSSTTPPSSTSSSKINTKSVSFSNLGEVLGNSITSAISTVLMIGGFIVLFSVVISILEQSGIISIFSNLLEPILYTLHLSSDFANPIINGFLELTNGVKQISQISYRAISVNITICSFLLGFGGISVLLQVFSIVSKTDISIFPYFIGKLLQGTLAAFYTSLILHYCPIFNLDLSPVSTTTASLIPSTFPLSSFLLGIILFFLVITFIFLQKKQEWKRISLPYKSK